MITSVEVNNWRGFSHAALDGLTGLTVLAGANGCGKSSLLEAILIAGGRSPADAVGRAVLRRADGWNASRWLFRDQTEEGLSATINVGTSEGPRGVRLTWFGGLHDLHTQWPHQDPPSTVRTEGLAPDSFVASTAFSADNQYRGRFQGGVNTGLQIRFVDPVNRTREALHRVVSRAIDSDRLDLVEGMLDRLTNGDLTSVRIATEEEVAVVRVRQGGRSIPAAVAGDGVVSLIRVACELAAPRGTVVLLEEPEVNMHGNALWELSQAITQTVGAGVQVILTTHSETLLDFLYRHEQIRTSFTMFCMSRLADGTLNAVKGQADDVPRVIEIAMRAMLSE